MKKYVLGVAVESDLNAIWEHIAQDNVDAADRWIESFFEAFETLARNPGVGHRREDLTALPVLFWPVSRYFVLYRIQSEVVQIVAVIHGARDVPAFLSAQSMTRI